MIVHRIFKKHLKKRYFLKFITIAILALLSFSLRADVNVQEFTTPKNLHVLFIEDKTTDFISVNFSFKSVGTEVDPTDKEGLSNLMLDLLFERTKDGSDKHLLQRKLNRLGVFQGLRYSLDTDNINFSFKCPQEKLKEALEIIMIYFVDPDFDQIELDKMKKFDPANSRLATAGEQEFASKVLLQHLFEGHPYANPTTGTLDGRQNITIEDVKAAFKNRFARNALTFSVIGNINPKTLGGLLDNAFGDLPAKTNVPIIPTPTIKANGQTYIIPKNSPQTGVVFGQGAAIRTSPDYLPLLILNDVIGGKPFTSRLWLEVREKRGLVYGINTSIMASEKAAIWVGGFESDNAVVNQVIDVVKQEWKNVQEKGITEAEFTASKTGLMGSFVLNFTTPEAIASYVLDSYLAGLKVTYINERNKLLGNVTLADVNRVAKQYLDPGKLTFVVVGNPE